MARQRRKSAGVGRTARAALGNQQVQQLAQQFGLPVDQAIDFLSQHLPTVVDQASPNGTLRIAVIPAGAEFRPRLRDINPVNLERIRNG